jgi:hypothetical protein
MKDKDNRPNERPKRFIERVKRSGFVPVAIGLGILTPLLSQKIDGKTIDVPPAQAVGALVSGSTSAVFHSVPDTIIDKVYEARYARLASEFEQRPGNAPPKDFQSLLRST